MKDFGILNGWGGTMACFVILLLALTLISGPVQADELYIFPNKDQSKEQIEEDKSVCYRWAKGQTGFDPMVAPTATTPPPPQQAPTAKPGRSAARGAVAGMAIGSLSGEMGKGAAIGATSGALIGGARKRGQAQQQQQANDQWAQEQAANYQKQRGEYNRAYGACLEGKGYTVK